MKNYFYLLFLISFFMFSQTYAKALDIIYPQKVQYSTNLSETYILGNINNQASLKINGSPVKIWDKNIFCHIVNLQDGQNKIIIEEQRANDTIKKVYVINKIIPPLKTVQKVNNQGDIIKRYNNLMYGVVINDGIPLRDTPSVNGKRISHLPISTNVLIEAEYNDWYKIHTGNDKESLWIFNKNLEILYPTNNRYLSAMNDVFFIADKNFMKMEIDIDFPVPYKMTESGNDIELTLWGIKNIEKLQNKIKKQKIFDNIQIKSFNNYNLTILIPSVKPIWGYSAEYNGNKLVFKKRKEPIINSNKPLHNITIAIDPGHGGYEKGTIGPGRVPEKDVNLAISKKLQEELIKNGAKVIMTRDTDTDVEIYKRPCIANENKAVICLSIHSNSMVDGNPYKKHGVETYYYNNSAKNLADCIKKQLVYDLKLKDNGTKYASFVMTRPTMPLSVLIEVAYMPNPAEYLQLIDAKFQQRVAESITKSLEQYLLKINE